jgi:uncharacterized repeat protein (TIGR01451 family)
VTIPVIVAGNAPVGKISPNAATINPGNGGDSSTGTDKNTPVIYLPVLQVAKSASKTITYDGDTYTYTITVSNIGNAPTTNPYTITDTLPAAVSLNGVPTSPNGSVTNTGTNQNLTLSVAGPLAAGQTTTVTVPVIVSSNAPTGPVDANSATVTPGNSGQPVTATETQPPVVYAPALNVVKKSSNPFLTPGEVFEYTLTITNTGKVPAANPFTVTDSLPNYVNYYGNASSTAGVTTNTGDSKNLILSVAGTIPPNGTATVTIPVILDSTVPAGPLSANSSVVSPGNGGSPVTATESTPPLVETPALAVQKISSVSTAVPGQAFNYVLTAANNSDVPTANPCIVTDVLPDYLTLNGTPTSTVGIVTNSGDNRNLNLSVAAGIQPRTTATITIPVIISANAPFGQLGKNTATVDPGESGSPSSGKDNNPPIIYAPSLSVSKNATVTTTYPGGIFNYVVNIANNGNYVTSDPLKINDQLPAGLSLASAPTASAGTVTNYGSSTNLNLSLTPGISAGSSVLVTVPVQVGANVPEGPLANNTVSVDPGNGGSGVNTTDTTPPAVAFPKVTSTKSSTAQTLVPGEVYAYKITVTNTGIVPTANPFDVSDTLPPNVTYIGPATASDGSSVIVSGSSTQPAFEIQNTLQPGTSLTLNVPVKLSSAAQVGQLSPNTSVTDPGNEGTPSTGTETTPPIIEVPVTVVTKTSSVSNVQPGGTFSYTITIYNNSDVPTANPFTITDSLPGYITSNGSITSSAGAVTNNGDSNNLNLSIAGSIPPKGTVTVTVPVVVANNAPNGPIAANVSVINPGNGGSTATGTDKNPPVVQYPILAVTKSADTALTYPGGTFNYTITMTNTGNIATTSPLTITDTLPQYLTLGGTPTSPAGTVTNFGDGKNLNLSIPTSVAPGQTVTVTVPVAVDQNTPAVRLTRNMAMFAAFNVPLATGTELNPPVIQAMPDFDSAVKSSAPSMVNSCDTVTYTITAVNTGTGPAASFTFTDTLPLVILSDGSSVSMDLVVPSITATVNGNPAEIDITGTNEIPILTLVDGNDNPLPIAQNDKVTVMFEAIVPEKAKTPQTVYNSGTILGASSAIKDNGVLIYKRNIPCCPDDESRSCNCDQTCQCCDCKYYNFCNNRTVQTNECYSSPYITQNVGYKYFDSHPVYKP